MAHITGFIGLGAMGAPMALCLLKAGIPLVVYDLDKSRTRQLCTHGAEEAPNPAEVARRSTRSICMVETTDQVRKVLLGVHGVAAGAANGHHAACMSTVDRGPIRAMASELHRHGITLIDAPVSGATHRAASGTLSIFVGADGKSQHRRCCPVDEAFPQNSFLTRSIQWIKGDGDAKMHRPRLALCDALEINSSALRGALQMRRSAAQYA